MHPYVKVLYLKALLPPFSPKIMSPKTPLEESFEESSKEFPERAPLKIPLEESPEEFPSKAYPTKVGKVKDRGGKQT